MGLTHLIQVIENSTMLFFIKLFYICCIIFEYFVRYYLMILILSFPESFIENLSRVELFSSYFMPIETTVFTFKINFPYKKWAVVYDSEENI